jgi:hypothetical protein
VSLELGFAIGAIAFATIVGGVLYALYSNTFGEQTTTAGEATPTASDGFVPPDVTMTTAPPGNSTASQNTTSASAGNASSPQTSSTPGY